jgi:hypothetical protein
MEHVFQSEWREWPLALGSTMPWGTTNGGAQLKSIANVGVQWPVAANLPASLGAVLLIALLYALRRLCGGGRGGGRATSSGRRISAKVRDSGSKRRPAADADDDEDEDVAAATGPAGECGGCWRRRAHGPGVGV